DLPQGANVSDEKALLAALRTRLGEHDMPPLGEVGERGLVVTIERDAKQALVSALVEDPANARRVRVQPFDAGLRADVELTLPRIDRIILYIDDLDRCPPHRVVEVLQAIHLLLAFPLFVVVVGVDARWVSRSLLLRYRRLWHIDDPQAREGDPDSTAATPQDYLEKIFQVPFWLEPMSADATRKYLQGLLGDSLVPSGDAAISGAPPPAAPPAVSPAAAAHQAATAATPPAGATIPAPAAIAAPSPAMLAPVAPPREDPGDDVMRPPSLELTAEELIAMQQLAALIGRSPRAVKRFVNVYRLIRAGIGPGQLKDFVGTTELPGPYLAVLLLLGLVEGAPNVAEMLFLRFERLVAALDESSVAPTVKELFDALWATAEGQALRGSREGRRAEALFVPAAADAEHRFPVELVEMSHLRRHLPKVARFAFRTGRA
ncbi:MAG TPA: P-loop NTPase fold protein, partial [Thermoanaerobaculia bacterium]|nr:P-loop NTPase fold protein [Thermoanaerobaculia bacterium]